jgi:hypothetical protein
MQARAAIGLLVALVRPAQEALDIGDELVSLGEAGLVGEELEALDV